jgi:hypothetical protein
VFPARFAGRETWRAKVESQVGTSIELFTGGGGLAYALHEAG